MAGCCVMGTTAPGASACRDASLNSALCACASSPSVRASVAATFARWSAPSAEGSIRLLRFWKSYTPSGDENRAVRMVGSTWLGPAQ